MSQRVRRNITIGKRTSDELDQYANAYDMTISGVVEQALQEFLAGGRKERIESKLDRVLEVVEGKGSPLSEGSEKKEKSSSGVETTHESEPEEAEQENRADYDSKSDAYLSKGPLKLGKKNQDGRANRIFNYLMLQYPETQLRRGILKQAIRKITSGSQHSYETYLPLVIEHLRDSGYAYYEPWDAWFPSEDARREAVCDRLLVSVEELEAVCDEEMSEAGEIYEQIQELSAGIENAQAEGVDISPIRDRVEQAISKGKEQAKAVEDGF